ncbi:AAA-ATPase At5g17760-like [Malania oleifera]|uniref:AAA-ATPase At5g17760-like n=1 Tax=Malania oleifera TaxID=397392 RepID=UPI0025ADD549|nr:AAA-ATPase At5g17760-like [Malania oleifera]
MVSLTEMPSASSLFSAYASMTATMMVFRSMFYELVPAPLRLYLLSAVRYLFKPRSSLLTLVIDETTAFTRNQVYDAAETYLCTKISPSTQRLRVSKTPKEKSLTVRFEKGENISDCFDGVSLNWRLAWAETENPNSNSNHSNASRYEKRFFELSFDRKHKDMILDSYLPFVLEKSKAIKDEEKAVRLFSLGGLYPCSGLLWEGINLDHPATFEKLAMDPDQKRAVVEDLDRFVRRKEFYRRVGRAWKRGYLLYGPPGTGKSSLIAAMANYLKFDVYDLQLANVTRDSDLRKLLLATTNRSILVIEDIDCSMQPTERRPFDGRKPPDLQLTLSGLLNFIDGLWSSCGDERIIVFTTNHKEKLDPALLRPGRMDMHIHMSYCTPCGFKLLASNYLGISGRHRLYAQIERLMESVKVTPAQVAEELMKSDDADVALGELVKLLKTTETKIDHEVGDRVEHLKPKRQKAGNKQQRKSHMRRKLSHAPEE